MSSLSPLDEKLLAFTQISRTADADFRAQTHEGKSKYAEASSEATGRSGTFAVAGQRTEFLVRSDVTEEISGSDYSGTQSELRIGAPNRRSRISHFAACSSAYS